MARRAQQVKLDSITSRKRLAARHEVYWNTISPGCSLGYRRPGNNKAGVWYVKFVPSRSGGGRRSIYETLGPADDMLPADGVTALSYEQARKKANEWFPAALERSTGDRPHVRGYTVKDACEDYLHNSDSPYALERTKTTVDANIIPHLGNVPVEKLTRNRIKGWMDELVANRRRKPSNGIAPDSDEALRRSKDTVNRILRVLKAALNYALNEGRVHCTGLAWRTAKQYRNVGQNRTRFLSDTEMRNFVDACPMPFRNLVRAALYSGARYGELLRLDVRDFDAVSATLFIDQSKSPAPRQVFLDPEAAKFFADVCKGRGGNELMFPPPEGEEWGHMQTHRMMIAVAKTAKIEPLTFHELRHTAASRWARQGLSLAEIAAQLGHGKPDHPDIRMTLRYAHLCRDSLAKKIRGMKPMRIYTRPRKPRKAVLTTADTLVAGSVKPRTHRIQ